MEAAKCSEPQRLFLLYMTQYVIPTFSAADIYLLSCLMKSWDNNKVVITGVIPLFG